VLRRAPKHRFIDRGYPRDLVPAPRFVDAARHALRDTVELTYPASREHPLFPNGITAPVVWRVQIKTPYEDDFYLAARIVAPTIGCHR
jgi:hypothetical protein